MFNRLKTSLISFFAGVNLLAGTCDYTTFSQRDFPYRLEHRISQEPAHKNNEPDKYALLVMGDNEERHVINFSVAYQSLLDNGFKKENIYILTDDGDDSVTNFPIDDFSSKSSLEIILTHLAEKVDETDLMFIYFNNHGQRNTIDYYDPKKPDTLITKIISKFGLSQENLNKNNVSEIELEKYLETINPRQGILLFGFCYSGGFAKRLGKGNWTAVASSQPEQLSYSWITHNFDRNFMYALSKDKKNNRDLNNDGKVSLQEAFIYAKFTHISSLDDGEKQSPTIVSEIDLENAFME